MAKNKKTGRFWLFAFNGCYPRGGMNDFKFSFNKVEEFEDKILELNEGYGYFDCYQVLNIETHYHMSGDLGTVTTWICRNAGNEKEEYK